jgi:hypothetical protein
LNSINTSRARALFALVTLVAAGAVGVTSCGSTENSQTGEGPCAALAGQCGKTCTVDDGCPTGLFCEAGKCNAECTASTGGCPANATCNERGRCAVKVDTGEGGGIVSPAGGSESGTPSTGSGQGCPDVNVTFAPQTPTVVVLVDQSGTMAQGFPNTNSPARWNVVYDVLMNPTNGVVKTLQDKVRFGLVLYSYTSGPTCPQLVQVTPPALNAFTAIDAAYKPAVPKLHTPTGESITAITPELSAFSEPGPKLILLATDGIPDRCNNPDGMDAISQKMATDAVQAAFKLGIETVIVAVGDEVNKPHQQDMANAGKGLAVPAPAQCTPETCATTYEPASKQAMIDAFLGIINGKRTCAFKLSGQVEAGKECSGNVVVNGKPVTCNDPNGWHLNNPTEIEFSGTTCDAILADPSVTIAATFPCDVITPPPK